MTSCPLTWFARRVQHGRVRRPLDQGRRPSQDPFAMAAVVAAGRLGGSAVVKPPRHRSTSAARVWVPLGYRGSRILSSTCGSSPAKR